jgi:hypothetical protein
MVMSVPPVPPVSTISDFTGSNKLLNQQRVKAKNTFGFSLDSKKRI